MWCVFTPIVGDDEIPEFARFCYTEQELRDAMNEIGPEISMFVPMNDPKATAKWLQLGVLTSMERAKNPKTREQWIDERIKEVSQSVRRVDLA